MFKKNLPYYLPSVGIYFLLQLGYRYAGNSELFFLLKPVNKIVEILTGSNAVYLPDKGYYHEMFNIIIMKECSGFKFMCLCFIVFVFLTIKYFDKSLYKILVIPASLTGAYILSIIVNVSRIITSIIVCNQSVSFMQNNQYIIHKAIGTITNLSFLVLTYYVIERILIYRNNCEKIS